MDGFFKQLTRSWSHSDTAKPRHESRWQRLAESLSSCEPEERARRLAAEIPQVVGAADGVEQKLLALESIASVADPLLGGFERDIDRAPAPLDTGSLRLALAADNLLKAMATEYQAIAAMLSSREAAAAPALKQATWLTVRLLTRRQWLACRAGKIASAAAWRHLHRLHRLARERGFAGYGEAGNTVESNYLAAVMLALADPATLPRGDLLSVLETIRRLAPHARLIDLRNDVSATPEPAGHPLVVGIHDQQPALGSNVGLSTATSWRIDLDQPIARLKEEIRITEDGPASLRDKIGRPRLRALTRLLERWRNQPVRRFTRQRMRPRVDIVTSIDRLWWALSGPGVSRRRPTGGHEDPAEWIIVDESADGFGLRLASGRRPDVDVGDVIGVGMRDIGRLHLCIVRRIDDGPKLRCQVGVQQLGPEAVAVILAGEPGGPRESAVRLPNMPAHGGRAGLLIDAGRIPVGAFVHELDGEPKGFRIGAAVEDNGRHMVHLIENGSPDAGN
jgi:hypothetical protein